MGDSADERTGIEPMRIIVDTALNSGEAEYQNMGDVAMLQVAVTRLKRLWPEARVEVLTDSAAGLAEYCPDAVPLPRDGRTLWCQDRESLNSFFFTRAYTQLPGWLSSRLNDLVRYLEVHRPGLLKFLIRMRPVLGNAKRYKENLIAFLDAMENADLLVIAGAGGFADSCRRWNFTILNTLEAAVRHNIPIVMFGQGMGPLTDTEVLSRARNLFPAASLITLRGGRGGAELLASLGVEGSRVLTTGDEAVELAYGARSKEIGRGVGINLRVAFYADVEGDFVERLRPVVQEFAGRHRAPLIPLPIAFHPWAADHQTIRRLMEGMDDQSDGGLSLDTPLKIIEQAGRCRIVVTGAYHTAVFALAQGIPVVCLANSPYYTAKFLGLEDQFGTGCETIVLDDPDAMEKLTTAMERAWLSAGTVRLPLQKAALRQIESSWSAYERVRDLLTFRGTEHSPVTS